MLFLFLSLTAVVVVVVVDDVVVVVVVFTIVDVGYEDKVVQHRLSPVDQLSFRMNGYPTKFTGSALKVVFFLHE